MNNSYIKLNTTYESLTSQFNESIIISTIEGYLEFDENFKISRFWPDSIITMNYYNTKEYSFCQQRDAAYWDLDDKVFDIEWDMRWALMQNNTRKYLMKKEELHQFLEKHPQLHEYDAFDKNNNYVGKVDIKEQRYSIDGVIYSLSKNKIIETHILVDK